MTNIDQYNQPITPHSVKLETIEDALKIGAILAQSGYFKDSRNEQQAVVKILAGIELGLPPVAALQGIFLVDGKLSLSASTCAALVKRSGKYNYKVRRHTDQECTIEFYEKWSDSWKIVGESTFTIQDAQRAGLANKQNWRNYTRAMLFARAITQGSRWYCADIFSGAIYSPDEINPDLQLNEDGELVEVEPVPPSPATRTLRPAITPAPANPQFNQMVAETTRLIDLISTESGRDKDALIEELRVWSDSNGYPRARSGMNLDQLAHLQRHLERILQEASTPDNPNSIPFTP
ncbi:hypothetical protein NG791_26370 [Laspinema sp. D1]|uniref:hypothetical protein n=1 Tax=Laspinema palackyanum TaxID=3231601 RepID=UPI003473CDC4|nr:hypothetical protein [Laspinema sp. D2b]